MTEDQLQNIDLNNSYELSLSSTILLNFCVSLVLIVLYPMLQFMCPAIFKPEPAASVKDTGAFEQYFWYIDMFCQPMSVYAQRGTMTYLYVLFENYMLGLLIAIAFISLVFLMPTYYQGIDESFNIRYLTVWSKLNMSHIEEGSTQIFVPICASVAISLSIMLFYKHFIDIYALQRQKSCRRNIPQNYVLMVSNIPDRIKTKQQLYESLENIADGIEETITIPTQSKALDELTSKYNEKKQTCNGIELRIQQVEAELSKNSALNNTETEIKLDAHLCKLKEQLSAGKDELSRIEKEIAAKERADTENYPAENSEDQLNGDVVVEQNAEMGSTAFLLCKSPLVAAQKCNVLLANNDEDPEIQLAPPPADIVWNNLNAPNSQLGGRRVAFGILLVVLFFVYFVVEALIVNYVSSSAQTWTIDINEGICEPLCASGKRHQCELCTSLVQTAITYIPTILNCILMSLLPYAIDKCITVLPLYSKQQMQQYSYTVLFCFLIFIQGFIQVALPSTISPETGQIDLKFVTTLNIEDFLWSLGRNLPNCTFVFLNYIIAKYYLFPALSVLNFGGIYDYLLALLTRKLSIEIPQKIEQGAFNHAKQLAYINHMFTISLIFTLISPFTNIVVLVTFIVMIITDRYQLLHIVKAEPDSELSPQSTLMKSVASNVYLGLYFLLISTFAFWMLFDGWMYIFGEVIQLIMLVCAIAWKVSVDKKYQKLLTQQSVGEFPQLTSKTTPGEQATFSNKLLRSDVVEVARPPSRCRSAVQNSLNARMPETNSNQLLEIQRSYMHPSFLIK